MHIIAKPLAQHLADSAVGNANDISVRFDLQKLGRAQPSLVVRTIPAQLEQISGFVPGI